MRDFRPTPEPSGKRIHAIAPIARTQSSENVKAFASGLAHKLAASASAPDRYVAQASKAGAVKAVS